MFNRQALKVPDTRYKRMELSAFNRGVNASADADALPVNFAKTAFNVDFSRGALKQGYGLRRAEAFGAGLEIPGEKITDCILYKRFDYVLGARDDILILAAGDGRLFYSRVMRSDKNFYPLGDVLMRGKISAENYRLYGEDVIILCSEADNMLVWNGADLPYYVTNAPFISSSAIHFERLFATTGGEKSAVWFSDDLDPTNFNPSLSEGGFIEMPDSRGALIKVVSYLNYVYVFREYGVSRIVAYADQSEFSASNLFVSSGKIYPGSVCLCGDKVMFLAEDGLYCFDGIGARKVGKAAGGRVKGGESVCSAYHNGKYYLACRFDYADGEKIGCENDILHENDTLLALDLNEWTFNLTRGADVRALRMLNFEDGGKVCAVTADGVIGEIVENLGEIFGEPTLKRWVTPPSALGDNRRVKFIRELNLISRFGLTVKVGTEREEKAVRFDGAKGVSRRRIGVSGKIAGVTFESAEREMYVACPNFLISM